MDQPRTIHISKKVLLVLLLIGSVTIVLSATAFLPKSKPHISSQKQDLFNADGSPKIRITPKTDEELFKGLQTYTNSTYHYSFMYPPQGSVEEVTPPAQALNSVVFKLSKKDTKPAVTFSLYQGSPDARQKIIEQTDKKSHLITQVATLSRDNLKVLMITSTVEGTTSDDDPSMIRYLYPYQTNTLEVSSLQKNSDIIKGIIQNFHLEK